MGKQGNGCSFRDRVWKIEYRIAIMMLADRNKVIGPRICEKIHPFAGIIGIGGEVLEKVIIDNMRAISITMEFVCTIGLTRSTVQMCPVPILVSDDQQ